MSETPNPTANGEQPSEADAPDELTKLRQELEAAQAKATENWNLYLRATAELDNFRKRAQRDAEAARKYGAERLAGDLLEVRDNLERGLEAAKAQGQEASAVADGMDLTLKQLVAVMDRYGVSVVDPQGEPFNPEFHQAMSTQESADHPANTVLQVLQKGYRLHDRLLRPALVLVSRAPASDEPPGSP
jgi:molecular chaperone GrpE